MRTLAKTARNLALILTLGAALPAFSASQSASIVDLHESRLIEIYKDIHANPELGFQEFRTAAIVANELGSLGYEVKTEIGVTGVVGILENGPGPVVMFRADMDANAVKEETGLPYASEVKAINRAGEETYVAHMCGHDAHTTWLIGVAKTMAELKEQWSGTLVLLAQPAEEPIEGALAMIEDGLYTTHKVPHPDYFIAMHTYPASTGLVIPSAGRINTGSTVLDITFHGEGGHGSMPHATKDPVVMAAQAITQIQSVVARHIDPRDVAVATVGKMQAGVDANVVPMEANIGVKLHFSTPEVGDKLIESITNLANNIARTHGVDEENLPTIERIGWADPIVNDKELIDIITQELNGKEYVRSIFPNFSSAGSEDASVLVRDIPGVKIGYLALGTAHPDHVQEARKQGLYAPYTPHNPDYQVDLDAIGIGSKMASDVVFRLMSE